MTLILAVPPVARREPRAAAPRRRGIPRHRQCAFSGVDPPAGLHPIGSACETATSNGFLRFPRPIVGHHQCRPIRPAWIVSAARDVLAQTIWNRVCRPSPPFPNNAAPGGQMPFASRPPHLSANAGGPRNANRPATDNGPRGSNLFLAAGLEPMTGLRPRSKGPIRAGIERPILVPPRVMGSKGIACPFRCRSSVMGPAILSRKPQHQAADRRAALGCQRPTDIVFEKRKRNSRLTRTIFRGITGCCDIILARTCRCRAWKPRSGPKVSAPAFQGDHGRVGRVSTTVDFDMSASVEGPISPASRYAGRGSIPRQLSYYFRPRSDPLGAGGRRKSRCECVHSSDAWRFSGSSPLARPFPVIARWRSCCFRRVSVPSYNIS